MRSSHTVRSNYESLFARGFQDKVIGVLVERRIEESRLRENVDLAVKWCHDTRKISNLICWFCNDAIAWMKRIRYNASKRRGEEDEIAKITR